MKNTIKRLALIAMVAVIGFAMAGCASTPKPGKEIVAGDFYGKVSADGNSVEIFAYRGKNTNIEIPSQIKKMPVTAIRAMSMFERSLDTLFMLEVYGDARKLTSVTIPDSVTTIGERAFADRGLISVTIGDSVTDIGNEAFRNNRLTSVIIPDSVTSIGNSAFSGNQLTSVTIGNGVTSIGRYAFVGNSSYDSARNDGNRLTSVTIPNNVTFIGYGAFANNQLTNIVIPKSVTKIEGGNLGTIDDINSGTTNWGAFAFNKITSVTIENGITEIGAVTFVKNELTNITIPNSVTSIGDGAFAYNQLTSVTIPDGVTIGNRVFEGNRNLANAPMSPQEQERARQRAQQQQANQAEQARLANLYRQAGNNVGNLRNTSRSYGYRNIAGYYLNTTYNFGDGNYIYEERFTDGTGYTPKTGTFRVSGDTVIFLSSEGVYSSGTIIGNTLTINGNVYR